MNRVVGVMPCGLDACATVTPLGSDSCTMATVRASLTLFLRLEDPPGTVVAASSGGTTPDPVRASPTWLLQLVVESGTTAGRSLELVAGRWKLGRIPRPQDGYQLIVFPDPGMSREQAAIEVGPAAVL